MNAHHAMVDRFANVYPNLNQFYMAGLMTAPMLVLELGLMGFMYPNRKLNAVVLAASVIAGVGCFVLLRQQTAIGDRQFLRSMIPHHAGAILMCEEASIRDPEVKELCRSIITGQKAEIEQMKEMLRKKGSAD